MKDAKNFKYEVVDCGETCVGCCAVSIEQFVWLGFEVDIVDFAVRLWLGFEVDIVDFDIRY